MKVNKDTLLIAAVLVIVLMSAGCDYTDPTDLSTWDLSSLPAIVIFTLLIPITAFIAFAVLIYYLIKLRHAGKMAMISKGIYKPTPKNWQLILLFVGIALIFVAPGTALLLIAEEGLLEGIGGGLLCLLGGAAVLVFRHLAREYLPTVPKNIEPTEHTENTEKTK